MIAAKSARRPHAMELDSVGNPVAQAIAEVTCDMLHIVRSQTPSWTPRGYAPDKSSVAASRDTVHMLVAKGVQVT